MKATLWFSGTPESDCKDLTNSRNEHKETFHTQQNKLQSLHFNKCICILIYCYAAMLYEPNLAPKEFMGTSA